MSTPGATLSGGCARASPTLAQVLFLLPPEDPGATLDEVIARVGGRSWVSSTCQRFAGRPAPQVAFGVDGAEPGRIVAVSEAAEALGCLVVNIHQPSLGSSSIRDFSAEQRAFKSEVDPFGLCNPGHLADEEVPANEEAESSRVRASGWSSRFGPDAAAPGR